MADLVDTIRKKKGFKQLVTYNIQLLEKAVAPTKDRYVLLVSGPGRAAAPPVKARAGYLAKAVLVVASSCVLLFAPFLAGCADGGPGSAPTRHRKSRHLELEPWPGRVHCSAQAWIGGCLWSI